MDGLLTVTHHRNFTPQKTMVTVVLLGQLGAEDGGVQGDCRGVVVVGEGSPLHEPLRNWISSAPTLRRRR